MPLISLRDVSIAFGGPPILDQLRWGARAGEAGRVGAAEPLFPRLEAEAVDSAVG